MARSSPFSLLPGATPQPWATKDEQRLSWRPRTSTSSTSPAIRRRNMRDRWPHLLLPACALPIENLGNLDRAALRDWCCSRSPSPSTRCTERDRHPAVIVQKEPGVYSLPLRTIIYVAHLPMPPRAAAGFFLVTVLELQLLLLVPALITRPRMCPGALRWVGVVVYRQWSCLPAG